MIRAGLVGIAAKERLGQSNVSLKGCQPSWQVMSGLVLPVSQALGCPCAHTTMQGRSEATMYHDCLGNTTTSLSADVQVWGGQAEGSTQGAGGRGQRGRKAGQAGQAAGDACREAGCGTSVGGWGR